MTLLMMVAGGLGAVARFVLDGWLRGRRQTLMPWGTWAVNLLGSLAMGVLTALVLADGVDPRLKLVLGTGFLGGFTTFSTASVETVRLLGKGHCWAGLLNCLGMAVGCLGVAWLGFWLAS
ncbi:fluoride efflux transporter CrcB [Acidipropionibacterium timonense]|uniref:fluoride efflux transporter CrcB n=1 Tax=Acidipropionibacterium timonense TaxID=2161818 RepID=UPI00102F7670|nr:fluoride efflux transporter CrcB [Acidipropionibacterium timonense]